MSDEIRGKRPTIRELYRRWEDSRDTGRAETSHGDENYGAIQCLRPTIRTMQEQLDRACDELFFQVLLAEGKDVKEARTEWGLRCCNGGCWDAGEERVIRES